MAYLLQQDRPLLPEEETFVQSAPASGPRFSGAERSSGAGRNPGAGRSPGGDEGLRRYRVEVGKVHGVVPGHLVGAIANEANISNRDIGQIKIFHDFSLVDLPENMPEAMFRHLQQVWVCGQHLQLSVDTGSDFSPRQGQPPKRRPPVKSGGGYKGNAVRKHPAAAKRASKKPYKP